MPQYTGRNEGQLMAGRRHANVWIVRGVDVYDARHGKHVPVTGGTGCRFSYLIHDPRLS
jgi:hypothetical protein